MYLAHFRADLPAEHTIQQHSQQTANLCRQFAIPELADMMYVMGLLHDVGKYQPSFQQKVRGAHRMVEHAVCGAKVAQKRYQSVVGLLLQYCICGHHTGIPDGGYETDTEKMSSLRGRIQRKTEDFRAYEKEINIPQLDEAEILKFLLQNCGDNWGLFVDKFAFFTRYCFSCLVDTDGIDTSRFYGKDMLETLPADFAACLERVHAAQTVFTCQTKEETYWKCLQGQIFAQKEEKADLYILNLPTGKAKTLYSMEFALERAIREKKERIIYVMPYNSTVDETAEYLEDIFQGEAVILRDQSTFSYDQEEWKLEAAQENWNGKIILTTAAQFFTSLFTNQREKARKIHRMANSILIFDEVHTVPEAVFGICLEGIAFLIQYLHSEAIFITSTMPNYEALWQMYDLPSVRIKNIGKDTTVYSALPTCRYEKIGIQRPEDLQQLARGYGASLIIVNTRKEAKRLYDMWQGKKYHLSTYMTTSDRMHTICKIKETMKTLEQDDPTGENKSQEQQFVVISTPLAEMAMDLEFDAVFRQTAGLEHLLQAGDRCGRRAIRKTVFVFDFPWEQGKPKTISVELTEEVWKKYGRIDEAKCVEDYYTKRYEFALKRMQFPAMHQCSSLLGALPFRQYANGFVWIAGEQVAVVVWCKAVEKLRRYGKNKKDFLEKLKQYAFSLYPHELEKLRQLGAVEEKDGIWYLKDLRYYTEETGVSLSEEKKEG